jgi:DNA-binding response OmpR family regulator
VVYPKQSAYWTNLGTKEVNMLQPMHFVSGDYVIIPFSLRELVARLRALIRRASRVGLENLYLEKAGRL